MFQVFFETQCSSVLFHRHQHLWKVYLVMENHLQTASRETERRYALGCHLSQTQYAQWSNAIHCSWTSVV